MNCVWMTVDSFRQDHVHCYSPGGTTDPTADGFVVDTPSIDRLAAEGVRFDRLRSEALPTVCARRSMFTGRRVFPWADEPTHKGMYIHLPGWRPLPEEDVTVAEHLSSQGYVCSMVADVYHLMKPCQNFHRGFQSFQWVRGQEYDQWHSQPLPEGYLERFIKPGTEMAARRNRVLVQYLRNQMFRSADDEFQAARTFRAAIEWLERNHSHEHFFLYVDSFDPHEPWEAPDEFVERYDPNYQGPDLIYGNMYRREDLTAEEHHHLRARYAAECSMVDFWVGQLLSTVDRLGLRDNTLIILLSDHGKIIGEFNRYGMPPQNTGLELNAVPCIVRHPSGEHAGSRFSGWVYNTDITVTMLELLGVPNKEKTDGRNVWPAIGADEEFRDYAVVGHGQMVSCWEGDWLYLVDTDQNSDALYHLVEDPFRQRDLSDRYPADRERLKAHIETVIDGREP